jgi:valyl-tRNA synthetase
VGEAGAGPGPAAKLLAAGAELYLPLAGLLDLDEERSRLERERAGLEQERRRAEAKLANRDFTEKAPAVVVDRARSRLAEVEAALVKVAEQLEQLTASTGG